MTTSFFRPIALAVALCLTALGSANATSYTTLNTQDSSLAFEYSQMSVDMNGGFSEMKATEFNFDPAQPENAKVTIEISLASVDAGYAEANDELEKPEWLNLAAHPLATFSSKKVTAQGDGRYEVTGELNIKGKTKEITAPVTFKEEAGTGIFEGSFTFMRSDFGIGEGQWADDSIVANPIRIEFRIVAQP